MCALIPSRTCRSGGRSGGRVEGEPPRPRHRRACEVGVVRVEVQVGEHHVPRLDPGGVLEPGLAIASPTAAVVRW